LRRFVSGYLWKPLTGRPRSSSWDASSDGDMSAATSMGTCASMLSAVALTSKSPSFSPTSSGSAMPCEEHHGIEKAVEGVGR